MISSFVEGLGVGLVAVGLGLLFGAGAALVAWGVYLFVVGFMLGGDE